MEVAKEESGFDKEGNAVFTLQIKDFYSKMKSWESGIHIESQHFKLQDVELYLRVYPNGYLAKDKGYVSIFLWNATKKQVFTSFKFRIGQQVCTDNTVMEPEKGLGWHRFLQHSSLVNHKGQKQWKITCTIMKLKCMDTKGTFDTIENIDEEKKRINDAVIALKKSTANQKETERKLNETERKLNETNIKLAKLEAKVDLVEQGRNVKKPICPICFEEMSSDTKIAQCISGHLICWSCKEKMEKNDCPSCGRPVNGRAFGMESYLKYLFQD